MSETVWRRSRDVGMRALFALGELAEKEQTSVEEVVSSLFIALLTRVKRRRRREIVEGWLITLQVCLGKERFDELVREIILE